MSKASCAANVRYRRKAYDTVLITLPKGRKETLINLATQKGKTVNGFVNDFIREQSGISITDWKLKIAE